MNALWAEPVPCALPLLPEVSCSAVRGFLCPFFLALGFCTCMSFTPRLSKPSTATKSAFALLRFRNSKVDVVAREVRDAFKPLTPSIALRLRLAPRALACEYLGVHLAVSSLRRSKCSVVSSMNSGFGWISFICLDTFAGGLPCRWQRYQGSPHSQVHCFVGRETWHAPHQSGLAKELSWNMVAFAFLA